jgi:Spy/CpxP family protein refolding chaperone
MKKQIIFTVLVLLMAFVGYAQDGGGGQGRGGGMADPVKRAERQSASIKEALALDDATTKKIYDIELAMGQAQAKARETAAGDRDAMREAMKPVNEKYQADLKAILTPEQQEKLKAFKEEQRAKRGNGGPGNGGRKK